MPSFYHGSVPRYIVDVLRRVPAELRNAFRKLTRRGGKQTTSKSALEVELGSLLSKGDAVRARSVILQMADEARMARDGRRLHYLASALERLMAYDVAYALRAEGHALIGDELPTPWDGMKSPGTKLLLHPVRYDRQSISYPIQYASLFPAAAEGLAGTTARLEPRLVPLFQRSYPQITFVSQDEPAPDWSGKGQVQAGCEELPVHYARSPDEIRARFSPLRPDPERVAELRARYSPDGQPVIGLAWGSANSRKDVPGFEALAGFLSKVPARFVSVQYGPVGAAVRKISKSAGRELLQDPEIDQMKDMDGFAAQLAALDAVVTVSNTGAHLAGALGVPMLVLLDDKFHLTWPYLGETTPWYPSARLLRKQGRAWAEVMEEAGELATNLPARIDPAS